jgi:mRNA-degrading endonuclease YafQ of YafQ-DinJ toxin-antitoxin module
VAKIKVDDAFIRDLGTALKKRGVATKSEILDVLDTMAKANPQNQAVRRIRRAVDESSPRTRVMFSE